MRTTWWVRAGSGSRALAYVPTQVVVDHLDVDVTNAPLVQYLMSQGWPVQMAWSVPDAFIQSFQSGAGVLNLCRVGWSAQWSEDLRLGETTDSFAFSGTGARSTEGRSEPYGRRWGVGDIIGCFIDLDQGAIAFSVNGEMQGHAFSLPLHQLHPPPFIPASYAPPSSPPLALFPHVLLKNVKVRVNFSSPSLMLTSSVPLSSDPTFGHFFIQDAPVYFTIHAPPIPPSFRECEVIMLVGLPASGLQSKTRMMTD